MCTSKEPSEIARAMFCGIHTWGQGIGEPHSDTAGTGQTTWGNRLAGKLYGIPLEIVSTPPGKPASLKGEKETEKKGRGRQRMNPWASPHKYSKCAQTRWNPTCTGKSRKLRCIFKNLDSHLDQTIIIFMMALNETTNVIVRAACRCKYPVESRKESGNLSRGTDDLPLEVAPVSKWDSLDPVWHRFQNREFCIYIYIYIYIYT